MPASSSAEAIWSHENSWRCARPHLLYRALPHTTLNDASLQHGPETPGRQEAVYARRGSSQAERRKGEVMASAAALLPAIVLSWGQAGLHILGSNSTPRKHNYLSEVKVHKESSHSHNVGGQEPLSLYCFCHSPLPLHPWILPGVTAAYGGHQRLPAAFCSSQDSLGTSSAKAKHAQRPDSGLFQQRYFTWVTPNWRSNMWLCGMWCIPPGPYVLTLLFYPPRKIKCVPSLFLFRYITPGCRRDMLFNISCDYAFVNCVLLGWLHHDDDIFGYLMSSSLREDGE